jgi:hypothetical protein
MQNKKLKPVSEQAKELLMESGGDFLLCYPTEVDGEEGMTVCSRSAHNNQIEMLRHILHHIIGTGKENVVSKRMAKAHLLMVVEEMIDYVYDEDNSEDE